ncbi:Uncharacterised protein [Vibrio cholerae]|uniref:Uncharacterized protein n=1 Tax=Vibrio cholerae TaxID=666 RepID=A0A655X635_VIBCL|nr:Uncharacterised protein [Vibrio cholerae]CSA24121.1 Uncharacterised protein [Vibrio cholerae]CSA56751.1 Uncharacterised protein [Vibrio cholerae]CSB72643.1 Uncharacterised protein [Vibrio cholerae]CSB91781.1 Uncharacterised protein [Vibrio cholerae]
MGDFMQLIGVHLINRHARPIGDHFSNLIRIDLRVHQALSMINRIECLILLLQRRTHHQ